MARTERQGYRGNWYWDGRGWGRRCWSRNCDYCHTGTFKRERRRGLRRAKRLAIGEEPVRYLTIRAEGYTATRVITNRYNPDTDCPHGYTGALNDWCEDCFPCPDCGIWEEFESSHNPHCPRYWEWLDVD